MECNKIPCPIVRWTWPRSYNYHLYRVYTVFNRICTILSRALHCRDYRSDWFEILHLSTFFMVAFLALRQSQSCDCHSHGGTTEEDNCSYLLPRAAAAGSNVTNKDQIHTVTADEIARFLVYRVDVTRSRLSANTGIPVCLVREIWQFKFFTGNKVTPLHEEGNS